MKSGNRDVDRGSRCISVNIYIILWPKIKKLEKMTISDYATTKELEKTSKDLKTESEKTYVFKEEYN